MYFFRPKTLIDKRGILGTMANHAPKEYFCFRAQANNSMLLGKAGISLKIVTGIMMSSFEHPYGGKANNGDAEKGCVSCYSTCRSPGWR